ncbi:homoserine dehydrogenase [Burkholderia glumae]|uniref:Homoserine dehydrogenase n=2 Tax=Burkholderia glumae TaxID=337 RepID=A0ABY5B9J9_BURGL|nr:homoserine dehydrogenase [Burkholderia glumae]USS43183.1 homoserine dehydrogenase [Burkholderia glumae]
MSEPPASRRSVPSQAVMSRCDVVISGFGAIGRRVAQALEARRPRYRERYGVDVRLTGISRSRGGLVAPDGLPAGADALAADALLDPALSGAALVAAARPHVLIEAGPTDYRTGGAGLGYLRAALGAGAHGIAISKGALLVDYPGLRALADANGVMLKISGATAAALPTIDLLEYNAAGCEVRVMEGIFTATSNYVLDRMMGGAAFDAALADAQRLGMAEPDPRCDVDGSDTACKVCILANAGFGARLALDAVAREGIARVSREDLARWRAAGRVPKLVGRIERQADGGVGAAVRLRTYAADHPFARVGAGMKAVRIETDAMGELIALGRTSPQATAAAALKDFEHLLMRGAFAA